MGDLELLLAAVAAVAVVTAATWLLAAAAPHATGPGLLPLLAVALYGATHLTWGWVVPRVSGRPRGGRKAGPAADEGRGRGRHPNR